MSYSLCSYLLPHQLIIWYGRITKVHKPWKTAEVILSSTSTTWIIQRLYFLWHIRCLVFWRCRCQPQCVCNFRLIFSLKKSGQIQSDYTRRCITCTEVLKDPARCRSYTPPKKKWKKASVADHFPTVSATQMGGAEFHWLCIEGTWSHIGSSHS